MHPVLQAFLADTAEAQPANPVMSFLPFILIAVVFYFVFFRPQQKQQKEHQGFLAGLPKGTEVVTQGGIIGTVVMVEDRTVTIDVGGGNKLRVLKGNVTGVWQERPPVVAGKLEKK
jgi:preprotein translocase subunit YajC